MKKIITGFLISALVLSACDVSMSKEKASEERKQEDKIEAKQLSLEEYAKEVAQLKDEMKTAMDTLAAATKSEMDKGFEKRMKDGINGVRHVIKEYRAIAPPDEQKKVKEEFAIALNEFSAAMDDFEKAMETKDAKYKTTAVEHIEAGDDYWSHAYRLLSVYTALPAGTDGTIDTDDLKELDQSAGMDRDSVLLNVSEDGKELVGKWGFTNDDGTPNINIVLHEDGKYEGYGNGEYKDLNNAILGRWEYDYFNNLIVFL